MTRYASIGGILSIVSGAMGLLGALVIVVFVLFFSVLMTDPTSEFYTDIGGVYIVGIVYGVMAVFLGLIGILAIIGGILAIRKKHWGWALAGAIAASLLFYPCGIAAVILTSLGKSEFTQPAPVVSVAFTPGSVA